MMTLNGNYRIVKPMVWRRSDLQGGLANGEHLFSEKKEIQLLKSILVNANGFVVNGQI